MAADLFTLMSSQGNSAIAPLQGSTCAMRSGSRDDSSSPAKLAGARPDDVLDAAFPIGFPRSFARIAPLRAQEPVVSAPQGSVKCGVDAAPDHGGLFQPRAQVLGGVQRQADAELAGLACPSVGRVLVDAFDAGQAAKAEFAAQVGLVLRIRRIVDEPAERVAGGDEGFAVAPLVPVRGAQGRTVLLPMRNVKWWSPSTRYACRPSAIPLPVRCAAAGPSHHALDPAPGNARAMVVHPMAAR